jgi:uncharacterized protein YjbJ (UPF0337 family)
MMTSLCHQKSKGELQMSWNRMEGNRTELKGKAKRSLEKFSDGEPDLIGSERGNHESQTHETHRIHKEKAEKHLANLHGLLKNMAGFSSANGNTTKSRMSRFDEETITPMRRGMAGFDNEQT